MPNYTELEYKARKESNELQDKANKLQQKMINEIETNNRVTSTQNKMIIGLTVAIVVLGILNVFANYIKTGWYVISEGKNGLYVLDTKTSQLWIRTDSGHGLYLGTNETPTHNVISIKPKGEQNNN